MPISDVSKRIKSLANYKYLKRKFGNGCLRQIDRYLVVRKGKRLLIANSFYVDDIIGGEDERLIELLDLFEEPVPFLVFLEKLSKAFRLNLSKPSSKDIREIRDYLKVIRLFIEHRFIVSDTFSEYARLEKMRESLLPRLDHAVTIYVIPTLDCNFACPHCYIYKGAGKRTGLKQMPAEVFDHEHDFILRMLPRNLKEPLSYRFYGGEPLLNKPLIKHALETIRSCHKKKLYGVKKPTVQVVTNAVLIDEDFIKLSRTHGLYICISFDGVGKSHDAQRMWADGRGSFKDVMKSIRLLEKHDYPYYLSWTVTPANLDRVPRDIGWVMRNLKYKNISLNITNAYTGDPGTISEREFFKKMHHIYDTLNKYGIVDGRLSRYRRESSIKGIDLTNPFHCDAVRALGGGQFVMRPDGKVGICQAGLIENERQWKTPEEIGHVMKDPERLRWSRRTPIYMKECYLGCPYFSRCSGGCAYNAEKKVGKMHKPYPRECVIQKFFIERALMEDYL